MGYFRVYNTQDGLIYFEGYSISRQKALSKAIAKFERENNRQSQWDDCFEVFEGKKKA
jgi:hypothetical protein